jgi:hypothetical protein
MQEKVDALLIGDIRGIKNWDDEAAQQVIQTMTKIPTGCVNGALVDYAMFGYDGDEFVINKKVADNLDRVNPNSYIGRAARVIE